MVVLKDEMKGLSMVGTTAVMTVGLKVVLSGDMMVGWRAGKLADVLVVGWEL